LILIGFADRDHHLGGGGGTGNKRLAPAFASNRLGVTKFFMLVDRSHIAALNIRGAVLAVNSN
jgi:hypothetical protein